MIPTTNATRRRKLREEAQVTKRKEVRKVRWEVTLSPGLPGLLRCSLRCKSRYVRDRNVNSLGGLGTRLVKGAGLVGPHRFFGDIL